MSHNPLNQSKDKENSILSDELLFNASNNPDSLNL